MLFPYIIGSIALACALAWIWLWFYEMRTRHDLDMRPMPFHAWLTYIVFITVSLGLSYIMLFETTAVG